MKLKGILLFPAFLLIYLTSTYLIFGNNEHELEKEAKAIAPESIVDKATLFIMRHGEAEVLREGDNGYACTFISIAGKREAACFGSLAKTVVFNYLYSLSKTMEKRLGILTGAPIKNEINQYNMFVKDKHLIEEHIKLDPESDVNIQEYTEMLSKIYSMHIPVML